MEVSMRMVRQVVTLRGWKKVAEVAVEALEEVF